MKEENFKLETFPTSESAKKMLSYVSQEFYEKSYIGKWLFQVMGLEYDTAREVVEQLPKQFFPETATWGLEYHEMKWGLPVRTDLSYEERRKIIFQKRDMRAPMTPYRMEEYLKNVTDFQVRIFDVNEKGRYSFPHPNLFWVQLIGEGTANITQIRKKLEELKQSHTTYMLVDASLKKIEIPIRYEKELGIKQEFYPRANIPYLKYNGTARYDGSVRYSKYKTKKKIELYPIQLLIKSEEKPRIFFFPQLRIKHGFSSSVQIENKISCQKEVAIERKIETGITIAKENVVFPKYEVKLKIGKHPNRYNGTVRYDGKSRYYVEKEEIL